ncbi:MAG: PIN domain-containing protein [Chloroflexi bacterium]|nr:PIN domain-containing protein [Chloroflexota bacterium]
MALILDTGPLYASMDRADPDHFACRELLESAREPLIVPTPVLVEVEWLATKRLGPLAFESVLLSIADGGLVVRDLDLADWARVRTLCRSYADLPLGLVDASVVVSAERLEERTVATLDHRHFSVVRPRHVPSLGLVPG